MIVSWHYVFTLDNIFSGVQYLGVGGGGVGGGRCDYIVALYFHSWQYLGGGIVTLHFHSGNNWERVIISWHYIFTPDNIWVCVWGGRGGVCDYIVTLYFHSRQSWGGGGGGGGVCDYIVTLYFHSRQYLGRGWLYRNIIFSLPTIFGEGVIISWHYIFTPLESGTGGDYIWISFFPTFDCRGKKIPSCFIIYVHIQPIELTLKHAILFAVET